MAEDPLKLRELPVLSPPGDVWQAIAMGLDQRISEQCVEKPADDAKSARHRLWWAGAAAAMALFALVFPTVEQRPLDQSASNRLPRIQAVSVAMEGRLDALRDGVVDAAQADVLARMERELMWLDAEIHGDPENAVLWAERVVLQSEMMEQYYRGDWRAELMLSAYD